MWIGGSCWFEGKLGCVSGERMIGGGLGVERRMVWVCGIWKYLLWLGGNWGVVRMWIVVIYWFRVEK